VNIFSNCPFEVFIFYLTTTTMNQPSTYLSKKRKKINLTHDTLSFLAKLHFLDGNELN